MAGVFDDYPKLAEFLNREPVAVLAVPIDEQGTIHTATLHFWHKPDPLTFFFVTGKNTEKCQLLNIKKELSAACVIGTYRGTEFSLQMRGTLRILDKAQYQEDTDRYIKSSNRRDDIDSSDNILLGFTPNWARYTDLTTKGYDRHFLKLDTGEDSE